MTGAFDGNGWTPETVQTGPPTLAESWTITLNYPRPLPGMSLNDRDGRWARAANTKLIREQVYYMVRAAHIPGLERIRIEIVWVVNDHHNRDGGENIAPWQKAIIDGIASNRGVSARIVDDDDPASVERKSPTVRFEAGCKPHFEITIVDLGSAD